MPSVARLTQIECPFQRLTANDKCYYYGEYTSGGGYRYGDTNQWIHNLKKKPTSPPQQLKWKAQAIDYWADKLRELMPPDKMPDTMTFVTIPGSKPLGHPDFDPRMDRVLRRWANGVPTIDIRQLLVQDGERPAQHEDSTRRSPDELRATMRVDRAQLATPLRPHVIIVDDVLTLGASFKAAQGIIAGLPGVQTIQGLFLARTVWAQVPPVEFGPNVFDV